MLATIHKITSHTNPLSRTRSHTHTCTHTRTHAHANNMSSLHGTILDEGIDVGNNSPRSSIVGRGGRAMGEDVEEESSRSAGG